jgi:hypothetical protein
VVLLPVVLLRPDDAVFVVPLVVCAVLVLVTGLQMNIRHALHRRRSRTRQRRRGSLQVGEVSRSDAP